jgi:hypothetical protein
MVAVVEEGALAAPVVDELVAEVDPELLQPASPNVEAANTISDQLRRRDMECVPFRC